MCSSDLEAGYIAQRRWFPLVGAPLFLVNGNHEQASLANIDGTPDNVAVWAQTARNRWYPQPGPDAFYGGNPEALPHIGLLRNYFSFEWGDALFVVIDPYWHSPETVDNAFGATRDQKKGRDLWNVTLGETQYRWFEQTLARSTATHRFVFTHHVLGTGRGGIELAKGFEWGDAAAFATRRPGWGLPIHQLMVKHGVTVFFQGHDHIFVHQELDGVIYQTLPEPANPNATYENDDAYLSGVKHPNSGHVRVEVGVERRQRRRPRAPVVLGRRRHGRSVTVRSSTSNCDGWRALRTYGVVAAYGLQATGYWRYVRLRSIGVLSDVLT